MLLTRSRRIAIVLAGCTAALCVPPAARADEPVPPAATATTAPAAPPAATAPLPAATATTAPPDATAPLPAATAPQPGPLWTPPPSACPPGQPPSACAPPSWSWKPGDAVPAGYKLIEERRRWLFLTGLIPFASVWGFSAILGAVAAGVGTNKAAAGIFIIPVAGPWIDLGTQRMQSADRTFVIVDGVLQTLSAAALVASFAWPKKKLVPILADFRAAPVVTRDLAGIGIGGAF